MLRPTVLAPQQPMGGDLEPQGKRTPGPPSRPTSPKTRVVVILLSKELALTPKASPNDKLVAFDDSPGEASGLRTSCTCEARAEGPSTVGTCGQVLWAEDPTCAGRRGLAPVSGSSPFRPVGKRAFQLVGHLGAAESVFLKPDLSYSKKNLFFF